jgi:anti-sigma B factor antagonist
MKQFALKSRAGMANTLVTVIDLDGELDITTAPEFEAKIQELFSQKRYKIVLNTKNLIYVSSIGFGALLGNIRKARENRGDIRLANVHPDVLEVLQMMEFHQIFQIYPTEDSAVRAF